MTLSVILLLSLLLVISAACSATEASILAVNKVRLRHLSEQGERTAQLIYALLPQLDRVIGTLLIANNLVNVALSAIGSWVCVSLFGPERGLIIATVLITSVLLLVGEISPKLFAVTHAEVVAFIMVRPLRLLMVLLHPVSSCFTAAARWLLRLLRVPTGRRLPLVTEEEIKVMIQMGREEGVLAEHELQMLHRIFEFSDTIVQRIMIPRAHIAGIDLSAKPDAVLDVIIEEGHSRIPVYEGTLDRVVGVIYARDLLAMVRHDHLLILSDLIRPLTMVLEQKRLAELLSDFQREKTQIAIVQDAQGKTVGLVTIEDVLEEIVGEIKEAPTRRKH